LKLLRSVLVSNVWKNKLAWDVEMEIAEKACVGMGWGKEKMPQVSELIFMIVCGAEFATERSSKSVPKSVENADRGGDYCAN